MKRTAYWIKFHAPGTLVGESWTTALTLLPKPEEVVFPDRAYAFTLHQREDVVENGKVYTGKEEQVGPMYYHPASRIETLEQVKANPHATKVLISNMETNGWPHMIWTRWGKWPQPYDANTMQILGGHHDHRVS